MSWGCLNVNSRCYEDVCTILGVWNVSRGFEVSLNKVLTFWCPSAKLGHLEKGNFEGLGCLEGALRLSTVRLGVV